MKQIIVAIGITILTSLYYFPFNTVWLPAVNTKMALAALAIPIFIINGARFRNSKLNVGMIALTVCGLCVSLAGLIAVVVNNTGDYTYASYFVSMWVWLGGAYTVVAAMRAAYGKVTIRMVSNFLIAVCVAQCIIAQIINANEFVANIVDSFMVSTGYMGKHESRLYGIGCALDVAGLRFCAVPLLTAYLAVIPISKDNPRLEQSIYIIAFLIISIFGSMIARTTSIGVILSIVLWILYYVFINNRKPDAGAPNIFKLLSIFLIIILPIISFFYNINPAFRENLRFGFEGFFSLAEQGEWNVRSNKMLFSMVTWPEDLKTWIIGDGYFSQPQNDYYYVGPIYDYYMGTDVGYSRLIFYFGLLGLIAFASVFIASAVICSRRHPEYALVFWMIALMNFIGWIKVSTDIFLVFAILLCVSQRDDEYENSISDPLDI